MTMIATAIYEHGVLRLLTPVELPEKARVRLQILDADIEQQVTQLVESVLMATGLIRPRIEMPVVRSISRERRAELARLYASDRLLSDLVIAERDER